MTLPRHLASELLPLLRPAHWTTEALCASHDNPDLWFAHNKPGQQHGLTPEQQEAVAICHQCPVRVTCLVEAIRTNSDGIWGGTTKHQRKRLRIQQLTKGATTQ